VTPLAAAMAGFAQQSITLDVTAAGVAVFTSANSDQAALNMQGALRITPAIDNATGKAAVPARSVWDVRIQGELTNLRPFDNVLLRKVTVLWTLAGFVYVAFVVDVFSRRILGWTVSRTRTAELVTTVLKMAVSLRGRGETRFTATGLLHHSDAGTQYTAIAFTTELREAGITGSIGSVGDALDNAFKPRYRLPTPARAWTLLDQAGLFAQPSTRSASTARQRAAAGATRTLWAPFDDFFETHLKRARFGLRDLRAELGPGLRALGEDAARLERLDAALRLACAPETEALLRRARARLEDVMGERLRAALKGLGPQPKVADVEALWSPGAAVAATFEDGRRFVQAVFANERHRLEALAHACMGLHRP
jgi:transposase InsO family protein